MDAYLHLRRGPGWGMFHPQLYDGDNFEIDCERYKQIEGMFTFRGSQLNMIIFLYILSASKGKINS